MNPRSGQRRMRWMAGVLGLAGMLLGPAAAFAIFPPVYHTAPPVIVTPSVVPGDPDPPVTGGGDPEPPIVVVDPPVTQTPEPATLITGLIGLIGGGYILRRRKK